MSIIPSMRSALVGGCLFMAFHAQQVARADPLDSRKPAGPRKASEKPDATTHRPDGQRADMPLDTFRPRSMLRVESHVLPRAKFPTVDVHVHPRIRLHQS